MTNNLFVTVSIGVGLTVFAMMTSPITASYLSTSMKVSGRELLKQRQSD